MKKIFAIGIVLLMSISMLVMAGARTESSSGSGGVTTIRVWTNDAHNKAECDKMVADFNAGRGAQLGIKVEYTVYGADWQTAMGIALENNAAPELFKGISGMDNYWQQGKLLAWDEIPGINDILRDQEPYHRNMTTMFGGKPYSVAIYGWSSGFHYNKALLQRAGFSAPPKTWAEFEQQAIAISRLAPDIYGYAMPLVWSPDFMYWLIEYAAANSIGHPYYDHTTDSYKIVDYAPYYEMLARIREAGAMFPGMESLSDDQQRAQFANGKIGFIGGAGWNVGVLYEQFPFPNPNDWDYAPLPVMDPNNVYKVPVSAGASIFANAQVKNDRDKLNKVGEVIRLFVGPDTQSLMFTAGKNVPLREDVIAKSAQAARPQWTSYGKAAGATITWLANPTTRLAPEGADLTTVMAQVLTGQIPRGGIRAAFEDLDKRYNAALQQAYQRGQIKREDYFDPAFAARMKR
ncbi:MAG: ABC transporter substrate-binding protein [Treponema sp.]|jgi:multiple sugar transport system substrate-binding protein|nr:ABC transporter substrate-binding protein [Treponema sp.]